MISNLQPSARILAYGQISLAASILVCIAIAPSYFFSTDQGGLSNYGTLAVTSPFFVAGFTIASITCFVAAAKLSGPTALARLLHILGVLYFIEMISTFPYKINSAYGAVHEWAALLLFGFSIYMVVWIRKKLTDQRTTVAFRTFVFGGGLATLTYFESVTMLLTAQLLAGGAFGYILIHAVHVIELKNK